MIKIYTSPTCVKCRLLKDKLTENNICFIESEEYSEIKALASLPVMELATGEQLSFDESLQYISEVKI